MNDQRMVPIRQLTDVADCLEAMATGKGGWAWEDVLDELRDIISGPGVEPVAFIQVFQSALDYVPGDWFRAQSVDEMEGFYWARLPAIRAAAKECGYAVAVHGSTRRDFDLMAMPWRDGAADKDDLARAMQKAACGMTREGPYTWEQKPVGRVATSFPICTTAWHDMISAGHVDLSIIAAPSAPVHAVPDGGKE